MTDSLEEMRRKMAENSASGRLVGREKMPGESLAFIRAAYKTAKRESVVMAEGDYEDVERKKAENAGIRERNKDRRINRALRKGYARAVFCYLVCYSVFVGALLVLSGFNLFCFHLPENVLAYLVGSTAAAAIGLVFAVTNGLFKGISA